MGQDGLGAVAVEEEEERVVVVEFVEKGWKEVVGEEKEGDKEKVKEKEGEKEKMEVMVVEEEGSDGRQAAHSEQNTGMEGKKTDSNVTIEHHENHHIAKRAKR